MAGVSALSVARGSLVAAPYATDPIGRNLGRAEVIEVEVQDTTWALRSPWYEYILLNGLHEPGWNRFDAFVADRDDPRLWEILERIRELYRPAGPPVDIAEVVDAAEVVEPATGESGIVELILETDRWREGSVLDRCPDLMIATIHMERSRW